MYFLCLIVLGLLAAVARAELPTIKVTSDNTAIDKSCRVEIPAGTVIEDTDGNGVIQVTGDNVVIEFTENSVLRGAAAGKRPDEYKGYGIRLNGHSNVTIRNARISGFWCGIYASKANGLALEGIDASDNQRAYLRSTPIAEDGSDWLFPHDNENQGWLKNYAAAIYIQESDRVTVRDCRVWHGQNALCIDRVSNSNIYDNDFSFNSGWGLAMWRCEGNVISRNAMDFCVRGYSHGVYNRGQDSAGILMFEQNNRNVIAENSATHGGDCFFGFAGKEAIGEAGQHPMEWYKRRGNNDNLLIGNDFSYAPAHGIEMTFSFGNRYINNRMVGNAICGVWGGLSSDTLIAGNVFESNGEMGYGLERGGINIEHARGNRIIRNTFKNDKCGVHLWGGPTGFQQRPWGKINGTESTQNLIAGNEFVGEAVVYHFRGPGDVTLRSNTVRDAGREIVAEPAHKVTQETGDVPQVEAPTYPVLGKKRPVGARPELRGRENIVMTEWGPWDHREPLVRALPAAAGSVVYELHQMPAEAQVKLEGNELRGELVRPDGGVAKYTLKATAPGVHPYVLRINAGNFQKQIEGTLIATTWKATFFKWDKQIDPREKLEEWRKLAGGSGAVTADLDQLVLKYGMGGPGDLKISKAAEGAKLGTDFFGMIARSQMPLSKGKWQIKTTSDDGVRVIVDGKPVIENWTWHVPTRDTGVLELPADKTVEIVVEHFEIDGVSTLEFELSKMP